MTGGSAVTTLDALAPGRPGRWSDGGVTVRHRRPGERGPGRGAPRVAAHRTPGGLVVLHDLRPDELDDDLAGLLATELGGALRTAEEFRRVFTGVVRSTVGDPVTAWSVFYANTLAALAGPPRTAGSIAAFAPVSARALSLVRGSVLDLGSCFGFTALRMADRGHRVVASDLCPGTVALLAAVAARLGRRLGTLVCDAAALPLAPRSVDTVTAVHLLEHLAPEHGVTVLREALRVARERVVVAVPFEDTPEALYGHVRCFDPGVLDSLGRATGVPYEVSEHAGGWLVLHAS